MSRALASLTAQYSDSENENEDESGEKSTQKAAKDAINREEPIVPKSKSHLTVVVESKAWSGSNSPASVLGANTIESLNKKSSEEIKEQLESRLENADFAICEEEYEEMFSSPIGFHRSLVGISPEQIKLPSEPIGRCANSLLEKISRLYEKKLEGRDMNASIQKRKDFRNPSIYEKLIAYCGIDELGTNYPPEIYDPHKWEPESYYEELARKQKEEMDRKEKERRERTKVEFVTGTAKKSSAADNVESRKRSKWDVAGSSTLVSHSTSKSSNSNSSLPVALQSSSSKPTVISAFGSIKRR
ncbi:SAP30-binding protein-like isoform X1 [Dinothrombium tinctorium]|uniref:SAP30-binding protein-like isoform X1 n=1 Tax=Dinothrombium tinctorium TaxID=1965070 RepID=A0A443RKR7_9ACAR|nr:SAP30-binding protein-like isoform X1 [Dinothrombium tinctorium]